MALTHRCPIEGCHAVLSFSHMVCPDHAALASTETMCAIRRAYRRMDFATIDMLRVQLVLEIENVLGEVGVADELLGDPGDLAG